MGYKNNAVEEVAIALGLPADLLPWPQFGTAPLGGLLAVIALLSPHPSNAGRGMGPVSLQMGPSAPNSQVSGPVCS